MFKETINSPVHKSLKNALLLVSIKLMHVHAVSPTDL